MMRALTSPLGPLAAGYSTSAATAGAGVVGDAASFGKCKPVRYSTVRVGAGADTQSVGIRCEFTRGAQIPFKRTRLSEPLNATLEK
jgi:hypothetical protein